MVYNFNRLVAQLNVYSSITTYSDLNQQQIGSLYNCTMNSTENTVKYDTSAPCRFRTSYNEALNRASGRSRKKSQISRDFQGQIHGKNGRFRGNFEGIFEASFAEK